MGSQAATTFIKNIRENLNEPLGSDTDLTVATAGTQWTNQTLLNHLNKSKNRLWDLVRRVREDYFLTTGYALSINAATKEYSLPADYRQLRGIKCTTSGYEYMNIRAVEMDSEEFKSADAVPASVNASVYDLLYVIVGNSKIKFANFPPTTLTLSLDYINSLPDFTLSGSSTIDVNDEQNDWLEARATYLALLKTPTDPRIAEWKGILQELTLMVIDSVSGRQIRDPQFVEIYDPY